MSELKTITMIFEGKLSKEAMGNFVSIVNEVYDKTKLKEFENKRLVSENDKSKQWIETIIMN